MNEPRWDAIRATGTCLYGNFAHGAHESLTRGYQILSEVKEMLRRGDSAETIRAFITWAESAAQPTTRHWVERIKQAEAVDARFGLHIPGDSALAVVFNAMEEAAYAGDPESDSRVRETQPSTTRRDA